MEHIVGFIILGLIVVGTVAGIVVRHVLWKKGAPKSEYRKVRYEYRPGCVEWSDMHDAIDTLWEQLGGDADHVASGLWVTVFPYEEPIRSRTSPTGYIAKSGMPAQPPTTEEEAKERYVLNGVTEFEKEWPTSRSVAVVRVRQLRSGDSAIDSRLRRGSGPVGDAVGSALFHEIAEHVLPYRKGEGANAGHDRPELTDLSKALSIALRAKKTV